MHHLCQKLIEVVGLVTIEKACGDHNGIKKVFLILPEDVRSETPQYGVIPMTSMPQLIEGKALYSVAFDRMTARYVEKKNTANRAGDLYDAALTFTVKKCRIELDTLSTLLLNRRVHALLVYQNGVVKYVKNLREEDEADSGDRSTRDQYSFRFFTKFLRKAKSVAGVLPPEITGFVPGAGDCLIIGTSLNGQRWCITVADNGDLIASKIN